MFDEDSAQAYAERAQRAYEDGDADRALHLLTEALLRRPADPALLKRRARLLVEMERFGEAERDSVVALRLVPDDPELLLYHGSALVARADFRAALADFERLRDLLPDNANLHVNCAEMALWLGDYAAARAGFGQALALEPTNVAAHFGLARTSALQHRCGESREWLARLVALRNPAAGRLLLDIGEDSCFRWCREQT
ncbi:MAG: tetratricopeptide repeat protein [Acidimicrobiales bacterium]